MSDFEQRPAAKSSGATASRHHAEPFPYYARAWRMADDYMEPFMRDLAKAEGPQKGLDPIGWAICKFMIEIANFQARRRARMEMLRDEPGEAPWIYRDLYQLDQSDLYRRVYVRIPNDALMHFHMDGLTWFLSWQAALAAWIGRARTLGRRPQGQQELPMIAPKDAYARLAFPEA